LAIALLLLVTGLEFSQITEMPFYVQLAFFGLSPIDMVVLFSYWTITDWYLGGSIGKFVVKTRVLRVNGRPHSLLESAVQAFGKTTIPFIDVPLGMLYGPLKERRQRLFNYLSRTIVVRTPFEITNPDEITLGKEP
jgi:uncharacterized RDD family membrane protein YckC